MMRSVVPLAMSALGAVGCLGDRMPTENRLGPPVPEVIATTRIVAADKPSLEVSAVVRNPSGRHVLMPTGEVCPLSVKLFPDSTGEQLIAGGPVVVCATSPNAPLLDLAPGDSTQLRRTIPGDSLASSAPGLYGVNVTLVVVNSVVTVWAGAIHLPLLN